MRITKFLIIYLAIFPILLRVNHTHTILLPLDDPLEYKVNIGDFQIYEYIEFYDSRLRDPNKELRYARDINGKFRNFTIEKGVQFKITVTGVGDDYISGTRTTNNVTIEEYGLDYFVRPMMNNLSLLTESIVGDANLRVQSDSLIERLVETPFYSQGIFYNFSRSRTSVWEKSGWVSYLLIRVYDTENLYYELEVEKQISHYESNKFIGYFILSFILILLGYLQFVSKQNK